MATWSWWLPYWKAQTKDIPVIAPNPIGQLRPDPYPSSATHQWCELKEGISLSGPSSLMYQPPETVGAFSELLQVKHLGWPLQHDRPVTVHRNGRVFQLSTHLHELTFSPRIPITFSKQRFHSSCQGFCLISFKRQHYLAGLYSWRSPSYSRTQKLLYKTISHAGKYKSLYVGPSWP